MKTKDHFCKGCHFARYVGGTSIYVCERKGKCPRVKPEPKKENTNESHV